MTAHSLQYIPFTSVTSERWDSLPDMQTIKLHIALTVLAQCELTGEALGFYNPPKEIREVQLTHAAVDQITCMWHGHRNKGNIAPPIIPLKIFVTGFGQDGQKNSWANIEVHPGLDSWEV